MNDAELVLAARTGDVSAFEAIFDRCAARVHDLALAMLRDREVALEVVEATFLEAALRLHGLEEPDRLPVWLLAVTRRNAALRAGPTAGPDRQPALPSEDPERNHLAGLVWEAVADLPLRDRTLIDFDLRQGLADDDLADALGVTRTQAQDLQARLVGQIEKGLAGYLIARTAEGRCPGLAKVLKKWDGRFTPRDADRLGGHVDVCTACTQARFDLPSPFTLYATALPAPFPDEVRARLLERLVLPVAPPTDPGVTTDGAAPPLEPVAEMVVEPVPVVEPASSFQPAPAPEPVLTAAPRIWEPPSPPADPPAPPPAPDPPSGSGGSTEPAVGSGPLPSLPPEPESTPPPPPPWLPVDEVEPLPHPPPVPAPRPDPVPTPPPAADPAEPAPPDPPEPDTSWFSDQGSDPIEDVPAEPAPAPAPFRIWPHRASPPPPDRDMP